MGILPRILRPSQAQLQAKTYNDLIRREAKIGGQLFGPVPSGHSREFFCLDEHTWVWHESWVDANGKQQSVSTRYDVRPNGVLKIQDGRTYQSLTEGEALNLYHAVGLYEERVEAMYHGMLQTA